MPADIARIPLKLLPGWLVQALLDESASVHTRLRYPRYERIYRRYHDFTIIGRYNYFANLAVTEKALPVPGAVVECGVWRGGMIAGMAEILGTNRPYYLFDSFEGMTPPQAVDGAWAQMWWLGQSTPSSPLYRDKYITDESYAHQAMKLTGAADYHVIKGLFEQTLPDFKPAAPIAILRLDAGWYEATLACLKTLYPFLSVGGIIMMDDYYDWDGCARALHDFLSQEKLVDRVSQFENIGFVVKRKPQAVPEGR